jgi:MGT family glycosyltransferase
MSRILFATVPVVGHIAPLLPLCRALVARGHDIGWYSGAKYRDKVEAAGARFFRYRHARDFDDLRLDATFPERSALKGLAQLAFDMKHVFIDAGEGQLEDLQAIVKEFPADVVVADAAMLGALFLQERGGPPMGVIGVLPIVRSSVDTAPFGLGLPPMTGPLGLLRNRALNALVQKAIFRSAQKRWDTLRERIGLPRTGWWMDSSERAAFYLQPSIPSFEYPRRDLPANVRFIGMMPGDPAAGVDPPAFWGELSGTRPVVHVTQGTVANAAPDLIAPALEGLSREDVLVVVSTGKRPVAELGLKSVPENARIAPFLSYPDFLPKVSAMVTNGGYGGVQMALSQGVPLVVAGRSEDKPEVAARVAWSGAGIDLGTNKPKPEAVRAAVRKLLDEPRYAERARALAAEYARYDATALAVEAVEATATARRSPTDS